MVSKMYAVRQEYNYSCCLFNVSRPCQNFPMGKKYERTQSPRPPAGPPADAEEGALLVRALLVQTFDRKDGTGADWRLMLESLYRAGFRIADDQLDDDARRKNRRIATAAARSGKSVNTFVAETLERSA
jgi:hypothetical protein